MASTAASYPPKIKGKYQLLGWMPIARFQAIKRSIAAEGRIEISICQDEHGEILDGFHRQLAYKELRSEGHRIRPPLITTVAGLTELEKRHYVLRVNLARRQLTRRQRRLIIAAELKKHPKLANAWLAEICGTTDKTVKTVRDELLASGSISPVDSYLRRDGKRAPTTIVTHRPSAARTAQRLLRELGESAPRRPIDLRMAKRLATIQRRHLATLPPVQSNDGCKLIAGDFRKLKWPKAKASLVLTDPPYSDKAIELWKHLAQLADHALKPGGLLIAYTGTQSLPSVIRHLSKRLNYVWMCALDYNGSAQVVHQLNLRTAWRPVLVFSKGRYEPKKSFRDTNLGRAQKQKEYHDHQQCIEHALYYEDHFTEPGDLVIDPCSGSFTTAVACHRLGRRFLGCDLDETNVQIGRHRLGLERDSIGGLTNNDNGSVGQG